MSPTASVLALVLFTVAAPASTLVLTQSILFRPWRLWLAEPTATRPYRSKFFAVLFGCPMCLGWWVGGFWASLGLRPHVLPAALEVFALTFWGSGLSWFVYLAHRKRGGAVLMPTVPKGWYEAHRKNACPP